MELKFPLMDGWGAERRTLDQTLVQRDHLADPHSYPVRWTGSLRGASSTIICLALSREDGKRRGRSELRCLRSACTLLAVIGVGLTALAGSLRSKPGKKGKKPRRVYKAEYINSYDIPSDTLHLGTTDLGRTFGIADYYKDEADPDDVHRVEKAFSKLESAAALVFQKLDYAESRERPSVVLVRSELNTLRKFLFLLHYRNGSHGRQFLESRFDEATAAMVEAYRAKHGLRDARAVWLRNMALLLENEHWEVRNDQRLLFTAREDYREHAEDRQLGIYRAPPGVEFILTENGLGLYEGTAPPLRMLGMLPQGSAVDQLHFDWTYTFAVTPKLAIILRSGLMTMEAQMRAQGYSSSEASAHMRGFMHQSFFADVPRTSPKTTYHPPVPPSAKSFMAYDRVDQMPATERRQYDDWHQRSMLGGVPLSSRVRDIFEFAIDRMTAEQAERVNVLMLTHCRQTISFLSPAALLGSVAAFEGDIMLSRPPNKRSYRGLKHQLRLAIEMANAPPATDVAPGPSRSEPNAPSTDTPKVGHTHALVSTLPPQGVRMASPAVSTPPRDSDDGGQRAALGGTTVKETLPGLRGAFKRKSPREEQPSSPQVRSLAETLPARSGTGTGPPTAAATPVSPRAYEGAGSTSTPVSMDEPGPWTVLEDEHPLTVPAYGDAGDWSPASPTASTESSTMPGEMLAPDAESDGAGGVWQSLRGWLPF
jgi:hypothetical protein